MKNKSLRSIAQVLLVVVFLVTFVWVLSEVASLFLNPYSEPWGTECETILHC